MNPLILALMLTGKDPRKPPNKPIEPTPFVRDTLFPLVGGPFRVSRSTQRPPPVQGREVLAETKFTPSDTGTTFYSPPTDEVMAHESGHILDARHRLPIEASIALMQGREKHAPTISGSREWFSQSDDEYLAEAFARAVKSGREHQFSDSTKVDRQLPGAIEIVRWLLTQPPFKK